MVAVIVPSLVYLDEKSGARVEGTKTPVKMIVLDHLAHGLSPAEIHDQYPYLSMAQIHAAFSYYYAHKETMDAEIERDVKEVEEFRAQNPNSVNREELLKR